MGEGDAYSTAKGVEAAIREAARSAVRLDPSHTTNEVIRIEYFHRFLSRVFSDGTETEWVLKGGTGILARVPSARATLDLYPVVDQIADKVCATMQR
jgi:adenosine deaminase